MDPNCPCTRDCQYRNAECHAHCEAYKKYEEGKRIEYAERAIERQMRSASIELHYARLKRAGIQVGRT